MGFHFLPVQTTGGAGWDAPLSHGAMGRGGQTWPEVPYPHLWADEHTRLKTTFL